MTLVSIITPSFNQSAFLRQAMLSVLEQDYDDLEYLVVDGGSTDGSVEIIAEYADRLAWWVSEKDSGQAEAINKGLAHARGEIVAWLNSDDFYLPGAIAAAVRVLEAHPAAVLVYSNMQAVDDRGRMTNILTYHQRTLEDLLCFDIIGQPAVFMRCSALRAVGGVDASLHALLDHQLWIKLALHGEILHVDATWAAARYHPGAKNWARAPEFGREAFQLLEWESHYTGLGPAFQRVERRARASAHRLDARYLVDGRQPWPALKAWLRAFGIHPPTALARLNLLASALLGLLGLGGVRQFILRRREKRLSA
jgi:glycosyltransferase involved in cell wall biosynthesis